MISNEIVMNKIMFLFMGISLLTVSLSAENLNKKLVNVARVNDLRQVKECIAIGANVNASVHFSGHYTSALIVSSEKGNYEIVKYLLESGADVNIRNSNGETALIKAAAKKNYRVIKLLIESGADVNVKSGNAHTALIMASTIDDFNTIKLLIESGADVNAKNRYGITTLMKVSRFWSLKDVKLLIEKGADVNAEDYDGQTAIDYAWHDGNEDVRAYLQKERFKTMRWIAADDGLRMRKAPNLDADIICVIPNRERVVLLEETDILYTISGVEGKWCKVKWKDKTGWVFGGFLAENKPGQ